MNLATEIAMADDHVLIRTAIRELICSRPGYNVTIEAANGKELLEKIHAAQQLPSICVLDISMPVLNGYETITIIKERWPQINVLILTILHNEPSRIKMLRSGADAYLSKDCAPEELFDVLERLSTRNSPSKTGRSTKPAPHDIIDEMSDRERQFLVHCCSDLSYKQIAASMNIAYKTADTYREKLFKKLNVSSRVGLAIFAYETGLVAVR